MTTKLFKTILTKLLRFSYSIKRTQFLASVITY